MYFSLPYPIPSSAMPCTTMHCTALPCIVEPLTYRAAIPYSAMLFPYWASLRPSLTLPCYAAALICLTFLCLIFAVIKRQAFTNMSILAFAFKCFAAFFAKSDKHWLWSIQLFCYPCFLTPLDKSRRCNLINRFIPSLKINWV